MRKEFSATIEKELKANPDSCFVTGDLGFAAFEAIQKNFAPRFINAGVAEQNMIGLCAGLALSGFKPWAYSIVPFITFRCLEQIRNDVCFHRLPVRLVGNGGGYTYGVMGATHHALEDLGVLKGLPNFSLFFPCTGDQVEQAVHKMSALPGPSYLRLGISPFANQELGAPQQEDPKTLTRLYRKGSGPVLIGVGHALPLLLHTVRNGLSDLDPTVVGVSRFPFEWKDHPDLLQEIQRSKQVIFVEEHYRAGSISESLSASLLETLSLNAQPSSIPRCLLFTPQYVFGQKYGSTLFHYRQNQFTPELLLEAVRRYRSPKCPTHS